MAAKLISQRAPVPERLAAYSVATVSGCIVWTAATDKNGYGMIQIKGAHRAAYEIAHGPLRPGTLLRHTCDNPLCINVAHLVPGDNQLNAEDRVHRDRFNHASPRYNPVRLNMAVAREIRIKAAAGALHRCLAEEYGVGRDQISRVVSNISWKERSVMSLTIAEAIERFAVEIDEHLDRQSAIPVLDGLQFQGDVAVIPAVMANRPTAVATTPLPAAGYPVVRGEVGANTHLLLAQGDVRFDPDVASEEDLRLGTLTVAEGSTAYLAHPEHAYAGIAPGTYEVRRQREQADEIRLVQD